MVVRHAGELCIRYLNIRSIEVILVGQFYDDFIKHRHELLLKVLIIKENPAKVCHRLR
jgi:hypothetical protein